VEDFTIEKSVRVAPFELAAPDAGERAGRLRAAGFNHDRWLDTVLPQRSLVA
jgi:hypothetical protein